VVDHIARTGAEPLVICWAGVIAHELGTDSA
jgi:hypothetical protein